MRTVVRNFSIVLAILSVFSGVTSLFIAPQLASVELGWTQIIGMPILLLVTFASLNQQPAKTGFQVVMQFIGLLALFLAPFGWALQQAN